MDSRCEVCGAPLASNSRFCQLCMTHRLSAIPKQPAIVDETVVDEEEERKDEFVLGQGGKRGMRHLKVTPRLSFAVVDGKYRLFEEVGRGAMGTVFRAEDVSLKRDVALKFLQPKLAQSRECAKQFRKEAAGMAAIRHPNVAQVYSYGYYGSIPYFTMEFLQGETAENLVDRQREQGLFLPLGDVIDVLVQVLGGLAAIHRSGNVHRDIKPANIMLAEDPLRAVIMDFGLVRNVRVNDGEKSFAGTPAYVAPELIDGSSSKDRSPVADIYSMGATAYELITGTLPFVADNWVDILRMHMEETPRLPTAVRPGLPEEIDQIVLTAMHKDPSLRYQTAEDFLEDLLAQENSEMSKAHRWPTLPPSSASRGRARFSANPEIGHGVSERAARSGRTSSRGRLLVADSDAGFRKAVYGAAKEAVPGCRIRSVPDGARALAVINEFTPHALVVDLALPEINGLELVATLRGDSDFSELIIVVVADRGGEREAKILSSLDVAHFFSKPVDMQNLADILRPVLERPTMVFGR